MKILQINSVCGYGSTGNIVVDLYRALKKQGHECCIAYGRGKSPGNVQSYHIGTDFDVYAHAMLSRITDRHGFYSKNATKKLIKWMREYNPDIIHLHNLHGYYINIEILFEALKSMDKPIIWTLHDCWAFTGHCAHFDYVGCNKWKNRCENCPQRRGYPASYLMDNSRMNYNDKKEIMTGIRQLVIVTPSEWLAGLVGESYLADYPIKVIHNGINLNVFRPRKSDFKERYHIGNRKIILGVANVWSERKGLDFFLELANYVDDEYRIVLVGLDKRQKRRIPQGIVCIDRTNSAEKLAEIYSVADVFVNPSVEETMGLTTVEALACGTPVIVRNKTALPEIVNYQKEFILPENDAVKMILHVADMGKNISHNCENALAYEEMRQYQKYLDLYKVTWDKQSSKQGQEM